MLHDLAKWWRLWCTQMGSWKQRNGDKEKGCQKTALQQKTTYESMLYSFVKLAPPPTYWYAHPVDTINDNLFCLRPIKCQQGLSLQGQRCLWSTLIANVIFKCFLEAACQEDGVSGKKYCKNWVSRTCGKYTNFCKSVTAVVLIGDFKGCENYRNVGLPKTCQKLPNCTKNLRKTNENYRKTYLKLPKSTENLLKTCTVTINCTNCIKAIQLVEGTRWHEHNI